jgi:hypothetical protein
MILKELVTPTRVQEFINADSGTIYVQDLLLDRGVYVEVHDRRVESLLMMFDRAVEKLEEKSK